MSLVEKFNKETGLGFVMDRREGSTVHSFYKTRLLREVLYGGFYSCTEAGEIVVQPFLKLPPETLGLLRKSYNRTAKHVWWTFMLDMDGNYDPICGVRLGFGDTETMQRTVFTKKKWID